MIALASAGSRCVVDEHRMIYVNRPPTRWLVLAVVRAPDRKPPLHLVQRNRTEAPWLSTVRHNSAQRVTVGGRVLVSKGVRSYRNSGAMVEVELEVI